MQHFKMKIGARQSIRYIKYSVVINAKFTLNIAGLLTNYDVTD